MAAPTRTRLLIAAGVLTALCLIGALVWSLMHQAAPHKTRAPKITLLAPAAPPPPPPPPPKFEKKPDPPKEQKEMKVDQPAQPKMAAAPSPELKMDGPAGDGPSGFAQGNITSEDISKLGSGGNGTGGTSEKTGMFSPFNSYAAALKGEVQRYLARQNALRRRQYSIDVLVWVGADGTVKRYKLSGTSGDDDVDAALEEALSSLPAFSQGPPANMPQPIRLRVNSKA